MVDRWLTSDQALDEIMQALECPREVADSLLQEWSATYDLCNYFVTDRPSPRFNADVLRWCLTQQAAVKKPKAKARRYKLDAVVRTLRERCPNGPPPGPIKSIKDTLGLDASPDTISRAMKEVWPSS